VASFGFGGSNAAAILEDAYHHLSYNGLKGYHCTAINPSLSFTSEKRIALSTGSIYETSSRSIDILDCCNPPKIPKLAVLSAFDQKGIQRIKESLQRFFANEGGGATSPGVLNSMAFTLATRRSQFPWRSFVLAQEAQDLASKDGSVPVQCRGSPHLAFVFTGQGAQYSRMGQELMMYPIFNASIQQSEAYLRHMGCAWSLQGMFRTGDGGAGKLIVTYF
jgi:acyl transferase domain-containing protein